MLDQLARHLGLYNDKVEISTTDKLADRMERAARRLEEYDLQTSREKSATAP